MKRMIIVSLVLSIGIIHSASSGETVHFSGVSGSGFELLEQSQYGIRAKYSMNVMAMDDLVIDGRTMKTIRIPGVILPNNEGAPNLPGTGRMIAIPQGATAGIQITGYKTELIRGIDIAPAPQIPFDTTTSPLTYVMDQSIYSADANYPAEPVLVSESARLRGVDYVILGITPFQYNPVTRDLVVYKEITVSVDFIGGNGQFGEKRLRNRFWEPILESNLLNYSTLPKIDFSRIDPSPSETDDFEYVIIVPDDPTFLAWADTIKNWRTLQGIRTGIINLSDIGGNTTTAIENYINNAYNTWDIPPVAVLLLSDYQNSGLSYGITSPMWDNYCVSDNIYGDVDNDDLPEIAMARITAQNDGHLSTMINKFLDYERNPPTNADFYNHPITAGGWQSDRWFIICTEICWGFMHNVLGKDPVREYAGTSGPPSTWSTNPNTYMLIDYFGPNGLGYIPATPAHLTDWGANATRINNDINAGAFLLLHRDHGSEYGWGSPDYDSGDLAGLHNDLLPHVFTINCLTGKYNYGSEVFTETFHRMQQGALSLTAASEVSYSFVNDAYIFGIWDYMWPNFDPGYGNPGQDNLNPCFANASAKHYLEASSWPYNPQHKVYTDHLFHHHGDAFTTIYSEIPQTQTVVHDPILHAGPNFFTVNAPTGAIIGLTVNGDIIGVGVGTGSPESIPIEPQVPGTNMIVTSTIPNYYRYEATVPIITTSGAYVIYDSCVVDDASGNGNGVIDFGESIDLGIQLENVGSDTAHGITAILRCSDNYVTLTDSTENYGDIANDETSYIAGAFAFDVSIDVPDNHNINFVVEATDSSDSVWTSYFSLRAFAPELAFVEVLLDDSGGNGNGILEGGETASLTVTLENTGGSNAAAIAGLLSENDDLVEITDANGSFGDIPGGGTGNNSSDQFVVVADSALPMGHSIIFDLDLTAAGGYAVSTQFVLKTVQTFEYDDGGLRATNDWEWGTPQNYGPPTAYSGSKCWGTVIDGYRTTGYYTPDGFIYSNLNFYLDIATQASMSFYHWYYTSGVTYDSLNIKINNGSGWQTLYTTYGGPSVDWEQISIDLSGFSGLAEISLEYFSRSSISERPGWYIDDLALLGCSMWFPTDDISAISIDDPHSLLFVGTPYDIIGTCENFGSDPQTFDVSMTVSDSVTHSVYYADTTQISLDPNASQQVVFGPFTPTTAGVHEFKLTVDNPGDTNPLNDTATVFLTAYQHNSEGGPDAFGYRWIDNFSQYPAAPTFDYIDLTTSPSAIQVGTGSGSYGEYPIGFSFELYGVDYSSVFINGYGYLSFGSMYSSSTNDCPMPNSSTPNEPLIAGFWDAGYCNSSYDGFCLMETFGTAPDRYTVIQYHNWRRSNVNLEWEIILHENKNIVFQYLDVDESGSYGQGQSAAVGLEDYNLTGAGISYLCNDDNIGNRLVDSLAIKWYTPIYAHDICVEQFISPYSTGIINQPFTPEVLFENNGTSDETNVPVRLMIDPGAYNNPQVIETFNSGFNVSQQFDDFTPTNGGLYTLTAVSELAGDEDPISDTLVMFFNAYDYIMNFENDNGGLAATGDWEWGTPIDVGPPAAHSGTKCWGTVIDGYRINGNGTWLLSNLTMQLDLGMDNNAAIGFWHWYYASGSTYDSLTIKINDGSGWVTLLDWYGGPVDDWEEITLDLSSYVGIVDLNFQYASTSSIVERPGWYIDDLSLSSCTILLPEIEVTPAAISGETYSGLSVVDTITISNTGDGTLNYAINCLPDPVVARHNGGVETLYKTGDFNIDRHLAGYFPVDDRFREENVAGEATGEPYFIPVPMSIGGPDAYGYTWIDSDEPGGPTYAWVDISSVGVVIPLTTDDNEGPFPLGFTIDYYGNQFSQIRVCSNGWVSFTSTSTSYTNSILPSTAEPNNTLAIFWDDLNFSSGGTAYYYADTANDRFIVSYDGVPHYSNTGSLYFQVIIYSNGKILYQYNTMDHAGHTVSASVGIENGNGTIGLEYDYNSNPPAIHDNMAILFVPPVFWLSSDLNSGSIPPGGGPDQVEITLDADGLGGGVYTGNIEICSNDPDESTIQVPVTFTVGGCVYEVGDINGSGNYSGLDVTFGVAYFKGGPEPLCDTCDCPSHPFFWACGDVNADCQFNAVDISFGVNYFKYGVTVPMPCPDCPPPGVSVSDFKKTESLDNSRGNTIQRKVFNRK